MKVIVKNSPNEQMAKMRVIEFVQNYTDAFVYIMY